MSRILSQNIKKVTVRLDLDRRFPIAKIPTLKLNSTPVTVGIKGLKKENSSIGKR